MTNTFSRSASDNIRTIIEKTESVYVQKFQRLINGTLCSGKFSKSLANEQEAVGAYFASGFYRPMSLLSTSNVSSCSFLPLRVGKPLFTDPSIVPRSREVRFLVARFCSPPLSFMKQEPFESTGIGLQYMQKLSVYTNNSQRYTRWNAD